MVNKFFSDISLTIVFPLIWHDYMSGKSGRITFFRKKIKKVAEKFGGYRKTHYLCNRF